MKTRFVFFLNGLIPKTVNIFLYSLVSLLNCLTIFSQSGGQFSIQNPSSHRAAEVLRATVFRLMERSVSRLPELFQPDETFRLSAASGAAAQAFQIREARLSILTATAKPMLRSFALRLPNGGISGARTIKSLPLNLVNLPTLSLRLILPEMVKPTSRCFVLLSGNGLCFVRKTVPSLLFRSDCRTTFPVRLILTATQKRIAAVFRPSTATWFILRSTDGGVTIQQFGNSTDLPVPNDYDGDSKADIAIYRRNGANGAEWWGLQKHCRIVCRQFRCGGG